MSLTVGGKADAFLFLTHTFIWGWGGWWGGGVRGVGPRLGSNFQDSTLVYICLTGCVEPVPPTAILGASCLPSLRIVTF